MKAKRTVHFVPGESFQNWMLEHLCMDAQASIGTRTFGISDFQKSSTCIRIRSS